MSNEQGQIVELTHCFEQFEYAAQQLSHFLKLKEFDWAESTSYPFNLGFIGVVEGVEGWSHECKLKLDKEWLRTHKEISRLMAPWLVIS